MPGLAALPNEVLEHILVHLDPIDVAQISQCCQLLWLLLYNSKDQFVWRELYLTLPLDDPRICVSSQGLRKRDIDWKTILQRFIRARTVLYDPSLYRPGERLMTLHTLVELVTWVPPLVGMDDFENISLNLAWVVAMLRGTSFFEDIELSPSATAEERQLCARLHTYYGLTVEDLTRQGRVKSRAYVYDMQNYCPRRLYGPFNAEGGVNWVHVRALHHVVSMHIVDLHGEDESFQFAIFPMSIQTTQVVLPPGANLDDEEDWAGVSGLWKVSFCFCDHRELLSTYTAPCDFSGVLTGRAEYNETKRDASGRLNTSIFEEADFGEVYRTMNVTLRKASCVPDSDNPTRPVIKFVGEMSDTIPSTMTGFVRMTTDGQVRWEFNYGEDGQEVWHSVGVQSPPPRPKPGSLRDRIAAFENSSSSAAPAPAPVPRPKPGGSSWKPKSQFPSTFPSASDVASDKKPSSMFASDAKESIQTGGTLKERMAALQNRGAFSAPAPVAPKPPVEKPKWKPPPVVAPVDKNNDDDSESSHDIDPTKLIPPVRKSTLDEKSADEKSEDQFTGSDQAEGEGEEAVVVDPEEEEKQRRAAIAARMARLGGARVGMAPMFGRPQSVKKSERVDEPTMSNQFETPAEQTTDEDASQKATATPLLPRDQPVTATTSASDEQLIVTSDTVEPPSGPVRKDSGSSPSLSIEGKSRATRSPPLSMPVPSVPRRAAPPRRKAPKTPEATPPAVGDHIVSSSDNVPALGDKDILDAAPAGKEHAGDIQEAVGEPAEVVDEPEHPTSIVAQEAKELPSVIGKDLTAEVEEPEELSADFGASRVATKTLETEPLSEDDEPSQVVDSPHSPKHSTKPVDEQNAAEAVVDDDDDQGVAEKDMSPVNDSVKEGAAFIEEHDEKQEHAEKEHVEVQPIIETKEGEPVLQAGDEAEEEEATRRARIAEKLAEIHGGVNPFPPQRQVSGSSKEIQTLPISAKRSSTSQSSADLPPLPPTPQRKQTVSPVDQSDKVQSPERVLEISPALTPTAQEDAIEPVEMEKRGIDSEDDTREVSQVPGGLTHTANDGTDAREVAKTHHELVTDTATDVHESDPDKAISVVESETLVPPPPPPPRVPHSSTRPISVLPVDPAVPADPVSRHVDSAQAVAHPTVPRRSLPPPPRLVPEPPESEGNLKKSVLPSEFPPLAPPSPSSHQPSEDEEPLRRLPPRYSVPSEELTDDETPPLPVPNRRSMQSDDFNPPTGKRLSVRPSRSIPPPPMPSAPVSDAEDSDSGEALPAPLRQRPATPATPPAPPNEIPLIVPPPVSNEQVRRVDPSPLHQSSYPAVTEQIVYVPPPFAGSGETSSALLSPRAPLRLTHGSDQEILDEEEGDPIDPSFHSPSRRTSFIVPQPLASPPATEALVTPEETDRVAHPKTIAERMAKLGGIKFGAAPPLPHAVRSPPPVPKEEEEAEQEDSSEQPFGANEPTEEEEEQARKERIAAKLAMMGGMRIGMMPLGAGAVRPQTSEAEERPPAPPSRAPPARPTSPPQSQDIGEQETGLSASQVSHASATSDEGVKVEIEDSEIEEISQADAQEIEEEPEEVPPPVPARGPRRRGIANSDSENSSISPLPPPRSPVPKSLSTRSASIQSTSSMARQSSTDSTTGMQKAATYKPQSEYVMVEEPSSFLPEKEEEIPPPPPARPSHRPTRTVPPPPPEPSVPLSDSISSQWEMPSIPSGPIEFSIPADISLSWPEDSSASSSLSPPPPPPSKPGADADVPLSSDDLMTVWGRVGVQICEVATTLFEKSKKSLIGDGTYDGFIRAVLSEVPNAAMPTSTASYGYLIYAQMGNTVQRRASEILPGDIMILQDAKLKGHKGLQSYHQNVGTGEPLVGVVSEFEPKKSKVRLFQANQHVGQQTVEAVSYRLEDLKSGTVQVFRVLEN
ncbi:hypothetical protein C0993_005022 [Termitomyces sp. T159_Od127]|nr:hypothetical protein C0993_005022 [Termitomyces sp. T159_Od127]